MKKTIILLILLIALPVFAGDQKPLTPGQPGYVNPYHPKSCLKYLPNTSGYILCPDYSDDQTLCNQFEGCKKLKSKKAIRRYLLKAYKACMTNPVNWPGFERRFKP